MDVLPDRLHTAAQSRALDRAAMAAGIPGIQLMERAGEAVLQLAVRLFPEAERPVVVCGTGNNGGDGFIFARRARELGLRPRVLVVGDVERIKGDARLAWDALIGTDVPVEFGVEGWKWQGEYVVDALFGTGLERPLEGPYAAVVRAMNDSGLPIVAVDLPSGLHADTGRVLGGAVRADHTVSFITLKRGMFTHQGPDHCGRIHYHALGVPEQILAGESPSARLFRHPAMALPPRPRDGHKGLNGHVLVVGGEVGYSGAVRVAGEAALRVGAGLVSVATRADHAAVLNLTRPELMVHPVENGTILAGLLERVDVVVVGPGLGHSEWGAAMMSGVLEWEGPMVVDADALSWAPRLRGDSAWRVFTPHPGEAARLLKTPVQMVQRDRFSTLERLSAIAPGHWLLKGCGTLSLAPNEETPWVCTEGNPGMGTAGMGDVLSGVLGGLLAQGRRMGWPPAEVVRHGIALHARAGDLAAEAGERGMVARDLMSFLRRLVNP